MNCTKKITPPLLKKRLHYIDRAKAIAMICVVFGHVNLFCYYGFGNVDICKVNNVTVLFQLPLFMFLSGLVVTTKLRNMKQISKLIYSKFRVLIMPLIVVGGLYIVWIKGLWPWEIFASGAFYGYWYLWVLFVFYLLHYFYEFIATRIEQKMLGKIWDVFWFCASSGSLLLIKNMLPNADMLSFSYIANLYSYFLGGVMVRKYNVIQKIFSNNVFFVLGFVLSLGFVVSQSNNVSYPFSIRSFGIGMILVVISCLYKLENKNNSLLRFLDYVGKNTLDVYIYHYFLIAGFYNFWVGQWILKEHYSPITEFALAIIPALVFTVISIYIGKIIRQNTIFAKILYYK